MSKELDGQMKKLMKQSERQIETNKKKEQKTEPEMTLTEFKKYAEPCDSKDDWKCKLTEYACKDYTCPKLKSQQDKKDPLAGKSKTFKKLVLYGMLGALFEESGK